MCGCATSERPVRRVRAGGSRRCARYLLWLLAGLWSAAACQWDVGTLDIRLVYAAGADDPFHPQHSVIESLRITVEDEDGRTRQTTFVAGGDRSGRLARVPVGERVRVIVEGLDGIEQARYRGVSTLFETRSGRNRIYLFFSEVGAFSAPPTVQAAIAPDWDDRYRTALRPGWGRAFHAAGVLADGTVLLAGGTQTAAATDHLARLGTGEALRSAERFDPTAGAFFKNPAHCVDEDGDGWGFGPDCAGLDCDDGDPQRTLDCGPGCTDADGDGFGRGDDCPHGPDCDDGDPDCALGACCGECPADGALCMSVARAHLAALGLDGGGDWLLLGGEPGGLGLEGEYYRVAESDFTPAPELLNPARTRTAAVRVEQQLLVAGGIDPAGELLDGVQASGPEVAFERAGTLQTARAGATAVAYSGGALIIGGWETFGPEPNARRASAAVDRVIVQGSQLRVEPLGRDLYLPRAEAAAVAFRTANGLTRVLVCGGLIDGSQATRSCEIIAPAEGDIVLIDPESDEPFGLDVPRWRHTATRLPDGNVLMAGGFYPGPSAGARNTAVILDPATADQVSGRLTLQGKRAGHTATLMANGMVLLAGGLARPGGPADPNRMAAPDYEIFNPRER